MDEENKGSHQLVVNFTKPYNNEVNCASCYFRSEVRKLYYVQGSKNVPSDHPEQLNFPARQATFYFHLPDGHWQGSLQLRWARSRKQSVVPENIHLHTSQMEGQQNNSNYLL